MAPDQVSCGVLPSKNLLWVPKKGLLWKVLFISDALVADRCLTPNHRNMNSLVLPKATWKVTKMAEVGFLSRLQKNEPLNCPEP